MEAARVAGAAGVGVATGGTDAAALWAAGADVVLPGLASFPDWLEAWCGARARDSAASGSGLDDEAGEGDRESDRAEQGECRQAAGG
jgi:hypothetical protein